MVIEALKEVLPYGIAWFSLILGLNALGYILTKHDII